MKSVKLIPCLVIYLRRVIGLHGISVFPVIECRLGLHDCTYHLLHLLHEYIHLNTIILLFITSITFDYFLSVFKFWKVSAIQKKSSSGQSLITWLRRRLLGADFQISNLKPLNSKTSIFRLWDPILLKKQLILMTIIKLLIKI